MLPSMFIVVCDVCAYVQTPPYVCMVPTCCDSVLWSFLFHIHTHSVPLEPPDPPPRHLLVCGYATHWKHSTPPRSPSWPQPPPEPVQRSMGGPQMCGELRHVGASKHLGVSKHLGAAKHVGIQTYGGYPNSIISFWITIHLILPIYVNYSIIQYIETLLIWYPY